MGAEWRQLQTALGTHYKDHTDLKKADKAALGVSFEMRYSTIKRDSAVLDGYKLERQAVAALDAAWDELKELGVLSSIKKVEARGARGRLEDVTYTMFPTGEFASEQKAANRRQRAARQEGRPAAAVESGQGE